MTISTPRKSPINIRALETQRNLIDKAAACLNKTRSDFMLEAACDKAENTLLDQRLFLVSEADFKQFQNLLEKPPVTHQKLKALLQSTPLWEK